MSAHYTLVMGTKAWSSWSLRPYLALRAAGVPFDEEIIMLRRDSTSEHIGKHSPSGRVPVLKISENGTEYCVWDSLAICETLAERHPAAHLWPQDARARAEARAAAAEMHAGFPDLRAQLPMDFGRTIATPDLRETTKAQIARILSLWTEALSRYSGPYLFGGFSIADCMYAPVCSRFRTYGIALPDSTKAYMERMFALPAMLDWGKAARAGETNGNT